MTLRLKLTAALAALLTIPFFAGQFALAAAVSGGKGEVTKITASSMVYDSAKRLVTFRDKVRVVQPDFILTSDKLELHLSGEGGRGGASQALGAGMERGQVEKIVARDNVNIQLPDGRSASSRKATYTARDEVLVMEGDPVLREVGNNLKADLIRFYLRENRHVAEGNVRVDITSRGGAGVSGAAPKN